MVKQILVVDDDVEMLALLERVLSDNGYRPFMARDGTEALELLETRQIDLILSDVAMPGLNGYQLCQRVKSSPQPGWALIPFIFISARTLASDIRYGKSLGADDYLTKPFAIEDLLAVIKGKLHVAQRLQIALNPPPSEKPAAVITVTIRDRQLRLDSARQQAWLDGEKLPLTMKEMRLLAYLARRPDRVVSDVELVKATHGLDRVSKQQARRKSVRSIVSYLRRKLADHLDGAACIQTVRGRGYMLVVNQ